MKAMWGAIIAFCFLVSYTTSLKSTNTLNVDCGNPQTKKPATITYSGDAVVVFSYSSDSVCRFEQDPFSGNHVLKVSYNPKDKCSFTFNGKKASYNIRVESKMLAEYFESGDDEKFLVDCNFQKFKPNVDFNTNITDRYIPYEYILLSEGDKMKSDFQISVVTAIDSKVPTKPLLLATVVRIHTKMIPKNGERAYMPIECLVETIDGTVKIPILASGCGTGFPWKKDEGFLMRGLHGESPNFLMFRIQKTEEVRFRCTFVSCKGTCDGSTCYNVRQRRSLRRSKGMEIDLQSDLYKVQQIHLTSTKDRIE